MNTKKAPHAPHARKDTFWNKVRVEKGLTLKEVGEYLHLTTTPVGMYFSGQLLPNDNIIRQLCDLFDVDFTTGSLEFQHAHRAWKAEYNPRLKYSAKGKDTPAFEVKEDSKEQIQFVEDVLNKLYGVVSCSEFVACYLTIIGATRDANISEILYGKVDYETYCKVCEIVISKSV